MSTLIECKGVVKHFPIKGGVFSRTVALVQALDDVSLSVNKSETIGLVGESGCGKTTLGRCILRLIEPTKGEVYYEGTNITKLNRKELRKMREKMQAVFQDPFGSLNPRHTVLDIVGEPLRVHGVAKGRELRERVADIIEKVGLTRDHLYRLPHEFSGGQRQRIGVARALALHPSFVVLDEPTSALDVSVQVQILNLLKDLQTEMQLTYLFISHDLSVVKYMSNRLAVMYLGKIVEIGSAEDVFNNPTHPYTKALISSIPPPDPNVDLKRVLLKGEEDVPSPVNPPSGCRFHTRCPIAKPICSEREPELLQVSKGHLVACPEVI